VNAVKAVLSVGMAVSFATLLAMWLAVESRAQTIDKTSITGAWTLNKDLSDRPPGRDQNDNGDRGGGNRSGAGGGGFGRGGGGYRRGGGMGRGGGGGGATANPEDVVRMRDAMRDITTPSDHLTITQSETIVVIAAADGRTTRLSPDGKKIKDDNTKIERKTKWDGVKLVSEINGLGPGKMTQTFAVDAESHQLRIALQIEGGRSSQARTITSVYDADAR
jgi:hypothetical protein